MVLDISLIIFIACFVIAGVLRGGVKTLLGLISTVLAFAVSIFASAWIAVKIYDPHISQSIITAVSEHLTSGATSNISDIFPDFVNVFIHANGIDLNGIINNLASQNASMVAVAVETAVAPCVISLLTTCLVVILFILLKIIFSLVINLIDKAFKLPVLKQLNRLLGFVCGLIQGIIMALLVIEVISSSFSLQTELSKFFSESYINSTVMFKYFYSGKILENAIELMR